MKKIFLVFILFLVLLCGKAARAEDTSFIEINGNKLVVGLKEGIKSYDLYCCDCYRLGTEEKEFAGYRIYIDDDVDLCISVILNPEGYYIMGYSEDKVNLFEKKLSNSEAKKISAMCDNNIITPKDDGWDYLNGFLETYLMTKRDQTPRVTPKDFDPYDKGIRNLSSTDEFLDTYQPKFVPSYASLKYDDDIINIVPKEWFFNQGDYSYMGKEYFVYVKTGRYVDFVRDVNYSHVFVLDIDYTNMNITANDYFGEGHEGTDDESTNRLMYLQPVINEIYYGIEYDPSVYREYDIIDYSRNDVVLHESNFSYGLNVAPNIYVVPNYNTTVVEDVDNLDSDIIELTTVDYGIRFIEGEKHGGEPSGSQTFDLIVTLSWDVLASLAGGYIGSVMNVLSYTKSLKDIFVSLSNDTDDETSASEKSSIKNNDVSFNFSYSDPGTGESTQFGVKAMSVSFKSYLSSLQQRQTMNYYFLMRTGMSKKFALHSFKETLHNVESVTSFSLYEGDSQEPMNINGETEFYHQYEQKYEHKGADYDEYSTPNFTFNIENRNIDYTIVFIPSETRLYWFKFKGVTSVNVNIAGLDGRKIVSSQDFVANRIYPAKLEKGKYYYISASFYDGRTGKIECVEVNPPIASSENTYTYDDADSDRVFLVDTEREYSVCTLWTNIDDDTFIAVYNQDGRVIAYDDDANYAEDDSGDYNANIVAGLYGQFVYVMVYSFNDYFGGTMNLNCKRGIII